MTTFKLTLSYKGTNYYGWQIQPNLDTIQGRLNKALEKISKSPEVHSQASGRTDRGVHALDQIVKVRIPLEIDALALRDALNSRLPEDIRIVHCQSCPDSFHPLGCQYKEYRYFFSLARPSPHFRETMTFIREDCDVEKMREGLALFVGEKNFFNYYCKGSRVETTVRTIFEASLTERTAEFPNTFPFFEVRLVGSGFLKQMVRLIMGALFQLGKGNLEMEAIKRSFTEQFPQRLGPVAPPNGLFLYSVTY